MDFNNCLNKIHQLIRDENSDIDEIENLMKITQGTWEPAFINVHSIDEVAYDNLITTTTSTIAYDNINAKFDNDVKMQKIVLAIHIGKDYSDYDPRKCHDGGKYGFDYWAIEYIYACHDEVLSDMYNHPNLEKIRVF